MQQPNSTYYYNYSITLWLKEREENVAGVFSRVDVWIIWNKNMNECSDVGEPATVLEIEQMCRLTVVYYYQ